jgi:hypothetical protein
VRALTASERRTIAVALVVVVPALLWVWAARPLLAALGDARSDLVTERAALARERALVDAAPRGAVVRRALDSLVLGTADRLLDANDDAIAGAELSTYVAGVARAHHVLLTAAETRGTTTSRAGVRSVAVSIRGESDFQGIVDFLRALERGDKLLRVDALALSGPSDRGGPARAHVVGLRATVVGFALATPTTAARVGAAAGETAR